VAAAAAPPGRRAVRAARRINIWAAPPRGRGAALEAAAGRPRVGGERAGSARRIAGSGTAERRGGGRSACGCVPHGLRRRLRGVLHEAARVATATCAMNWRGICACAREAQSSLTTVIYHKILYKLCCKPDVASPRFTHCISCHRPRLVRVPPSWSVVEARARPRPPGASEVGRFATPGQEPPTADMVFPASWLAADLAGRALCAPIGRM